MTDFLVNWLAVLPGYSTPFALAALGLIICERSGVLNLGVDGFMLIGALAGVAVMLTFGNFPLLAILGAALASTIFALLFALLAVGMRINQVIAGLAIVFTAQALTSLVAAQQGWNNMPFAGIKPVPLGPLADLPIVGRIVFSQDIVVYALPILCAAIAFGLMRTEQGLRLRAVGQNPAAADAAGVDITKMRIAAVLIGAALMGMAGGYITVGISKIWVDNVTGGRGWIVIALVIFARWGPWKALAGALLFGGIEAAIPRIAAVGIQVPQYFMLMTPYLATLFVMVWTSRTSAPHSSVPAALGQPHVREGRA